MPEGMFVPDKVQSFDEIADEFNERVQRLIYATVTTIDPHNRPRSRVMHPVWEGSTCWISTYSHSPKREHLAHNNHVALAYISDMWKPVYADCTAEWVTDLAEKQRVWEYIKSLPEPYGYDPAMLWRTYDDPVYGLLKLTPWRIEVYSLGVDTKVWYPAKIAAE